VAAAAAAEARAAAEAAEQQRLADPAVQHQMAYAKEVHGLVAAAVATTLDEFIDRAIAVSDEPGL